MGFIDPLKVEVNCYLCGNKLDSPHRVVCLCPVSISTLFCGRFVELSETMSLPLFYFYSISFL